MLHTRQRGRHETINHLKSRESSWNRRIPRLLCFLIIALNFQNATWADLIPFGHKSVQHHLVFVDSPALKENRLIAAPIRGFSGFEEITAGHRFSFSNKYHTRIYRVPFDYEPPKGVFHDEPLRFPHADPPVVSITSVPIFLNISRIETKCQLISVSDDTLAIEVLEQCKLDVTGKRTEGGLNLIAKITICIFGLSMCVVIGKVRIAKNHTKQKN